MNLIEYICIQYSFLSYIKQTVLIHAPAMLSDYRAKPTREMMFYKWSRSSGFTAKKVKTDSERDRILKGIINLLYAYMLHVVLFCALIFFIL